MSRNTKEALLRDGLIVEAQRKVVGRDTFGAIAITEYEMPTPVHMQWAAAVAATEEKIAGVENALAQRDEA